MGGRQQTTRKHQTHADKGLECRNVLSRIRNAGIGFE